MKLQNTNLIYQGQEPCQTFKDQVIWTCFNPISYGEDRFKLVQIDSICIPPSNNSNCEIGTKKQEIHSDTRNSAHAPPAAW